MSLILSNFGFKYFFLFTNDYSRFTSVFPTKNKFEVPKHFHLFHCFIENMCNAKIKLLQIDSGGEYTSNSFKTYLHENNIIRCLSCPNTPSQNG